MKRLLLLVAALVSSAALAQSAKNSMSFSNLALLPRAGTLTTQGLNGQWVDVMQATISTSQQKDLQIGASLEVGLFTDTTVSSSKGTKDTSSAEAGVEVQVVLDEGTANERVAAPGLVTYDKRTQTLIAQFGGILQSCTDANGDGTITSDECTFTDETLESILDTLSTHSFFFGLSNVGTGTHTVTVQARVHYSSSAQAGSATANAWIGKGGMTVEEVRLVQNADISL